MHRQREELIELLRENDEKYSANQNRRIAHQPYL